MYWIFFVTMAMLLVSGGLLYFGFYSGYDVAMLHWVGTWVILAFVVLHVLTQYKSGGLSQLLRIFRPAPLPAPPPRLDAVELLGLLAEQSARRPNPKVSTHRPKPHRTRCSRGQTRVANARADPTPPPGPGPARSRNPTLQANAFVVAAAAAITGASFIVATDQFAVDHLRIHRINRHRRADPRRRHFGPGLARRQAVLAPDRRRRKFRRQGRNQDHGSRGA